MAGASRRENHGPGLESVGGPAGAKPSIGKSVFDQSATRCGGHSIDWLSTDGLTLFSQDIISDRNSTSVRCQTRGRVYKPERITGKIGSKLNNIDMLSAAQGNTSNSGIPWETTGVFSPLQSMRLP